MAGESPAGNYVVFSLSDNLPLCTDLDDPTGGRILLYQMGYKGPQAWRQAAPSLTAYLECQVNLAEAGFVTTNFLPHLGMTVAQYAPGKDKSVQEAILHRHGLTELPELVWARPAVAIGVLPDLAISHRFRMQPHGASQESDRPGGHRPPTSCGSMSRCCSSWPDI